MTFVNVRGVSFVYDIKSQRSKQDRCAEGIVDTVDRNVEQLTIGGVKVIAYGSDNCNLMNKVRCIIVAKYCIWRIGCIMHVVQRTFVGIIKLDILGIQEARESVSKLIDKLYNTSLLHLLRNLLGIRPNQKLGKPTSANS